MKKFVNVYGETAVKFAKEAGIPVQTYADNSDGGGPRNPSGDIVRKKLEADPGLVYVIVYTEFSMSKLDAAA